MTEDAPRPVGEIVAEARQRIAQAGRGTPIPARDLGDDLEDLEEIRGRSLEQMRAEHWGAVCPARFYQATLDDFADQPDAHAQLAEWVARPDGRNLVLLGPTGTGKTHAALGAVREAHGRGLYVAFLPVVELLDLLRPGGPEDALERLMHVDRLVLDDLGAEKASDWTAERLYALINRRWLEERPTVVTTNLGLEELASTVGARMFSRLTGSGAVLVHLGGQDRRFQS